MTFMAMEVISEAKLSKVDALRPYTLKTVDRKAEIVANLDNIYIYEIGDIVAISRTFR